MLTKKAVEPLIPQIFSLRSSDDFNRLALTLFRLHFEHNPIYGRFVRYLYPALDPQEIRHYTQIPCLPIDFFKTQTVLLDGFEADDFFMSSGTVSQGAVQSRHYIVDASLYEQCFLKAFELFWGKPEDYVFLALLPNYAEQPHSSLICMMEKLIALSRSRHSESGFYLYDNERLAEQLRFLEQKGIKTMLFGVSFALLDLAEQFPMPLSHTAVLETGGMKGRRKEMVKEELHHILRSAFSLPVVYSEYGMCELFSQAYATGTDLRFNCPPWMKVLVRRSNDPLQAEKKGVAGGINVIDLGNLYSCPFIATQDLGKVFSDESFEVLGRFDNSDIRGCNLMIS